MEVRMRKMSSKFSESGDDDIIDETDITATKKKVVRQRTFSEIIVVKHDNAFKEYFDMLMLPVSCYNVFGNAYYSAFGSSSNIYIIIIDWIVETLFLIDIVFCFTQEYLDDDTYNLVSDLPTIAKEYAKGNFIFDFFAWIPFNIIYSEHRLYRLFKLLRIPRTTQLIEVTYMKKIMNAIIDRKLEAKSKEGHERFEHKDEGFPIKKTI